MPDPGTWDGQGALRVTAFASRGCFLDSVRRATGGGSVSAATKIEWTRSDDGTAGATWNPVTGCTKVSASCDHCYAETFTERWPGPALAG
jgi:Protein of unknown function (DUF5131)